MKTREAHHHFTIYHVVPREDGWHVAKEQRRNGSRERIYKSKEEAVAHAKELALTDGYGHVRVHGRDGKIATDYTITQEMRRQFQEAYIAKPRGRGRGRRS
jgi:hypothetical protein